MGEEAVGSGGQTLMASYREQKTYSMSSRESDRWTTLVTMFHTFNRWFKTCTALHVEQPLHNVDISLFRTSAFGDVRTCVPCKLHTAA